MNYFVKLQSGKKREFLTILWKLNLIAYILDVPILSDIARFIGVHITQMKRTLAARNYLMKNHFLPALEPVTLPIQFYLNASHFHLVTSKFGWMLARVNFQEVTKEIYPTNKQMVK